jgi:predicted SprT family Zn-dependent metalloprotease
MGLSLFSLLTKHSRHLLTRTIRLGRTLVQATIRQRRMEVMYSVNCFFCKKDFWVARELYREARARGVQAWLCGSCYEKVKNFTIEEK